MGTRSPRVGLFLRGGSYAYQDEILVGAHQECRARGVDLACFAGGNITLPDPRNFVYALPGPQDLDAAIFVKGTMGAEDGDPAVGRVIERLRPLTMCTIGAREVGFAVLVPGVAVGGWSASTAGSTPHRSRAKARIDGQAVRSVMTNPGRPKVPQSDRS